VDGLAGLVEREREEGVEGAPEDVREALAEREGDEGSHAGARALAAGALSALAPARPDAVAGASEALRAGLDAGDPDVVRGAAGALAALSDHRPAAVRPALPALLDRLVADEDEGVRANAALAASAVAEADPAALADHRDAVPGLLDLCDHDRPVVRGAAVGVLGYLLEVHPDAVADPAPVAARLEDVDEDERVRASAVFALRALADAGDDRARAALDRAAREDPSERVRALAGGG
jgi:HEAT repeat protein